MIEGFADATMLIDVLVGDDNVDRFYVYALHLGDRLVYIGKCERIRDRLRQHLIKRSTNPEWKFDRLSFKTFDEAWKAELAEEDLIGKWQPAYNVRLKRLRKRIDMALLGFPPDEELIGLRRRI